MRSRSARTTSQSRRSGATSALARGCFRRQKRAARASQNCLRWLGATSSLRSARVTQRALDSVRRGRTSVARRIACAPTTARPSRMAAPARRAADQDRRARPSPGARPDRLPGSCVGRRRGDGRVWPRRWRSRSPHRRNEPRSLDRSRAARILPCRLSGIPCSGRRRSPQKCGQAAAPGDCAPNRYARQLQLLLQRTRCATRQESLVG